MNISFLLLLLLLSPAISFSYEARNHEVEALIGIREALNDPHGVLNNWDEDSVDPCSWSMITCSSDNLVTALGAPSQGLSGRLSWMIGNLTNLKQILLQNNNISGNIPKELDKLPNLQTLDLSDNNFSGHVPESLGHLVNLKYLRLNNNSLTGSIPLSLTRIPQLTFLDLSFNNLSGLVPEFPTRTFSVAGNPLICGSHPIDICSGSVNPMPLSFYINPSGKTNSRRVAIALGFSLSFVLFILAIGYLAWQSCRRKKQAVIDLNVFQAECEVTLGNLMNFTFKELQLATNYFSSKNILGSGGFGNVYKGKLSDGTMVAVKRLKDINGSAGEAQFRTELELISLAVHRNLLRLIGYCATSNERLLVYPYMSNGSVASRLRGKSPLNWTTRKRIAIGAARGLLYLHEQCDPKIIHRDVKAANVLLDDLFEAIVGDFGLAKLLDHTESHITTAVRGTVGHIAPEYLSTGQSSEKTDVFGFGILLLELITGMRALEFGKNVHQKGAMLDWVKNIQQEKNIELLMDKGLGCDYNQIDVGEMLKVALLCTQYLPINRPKMSEVVCMLEGDGIAEKWAACHTTSYNLYSSDKVQSLQNPVNGYDDSEHHLILFDTMTTDEDYDTNAMELSGPR